VDLDWQKYVKTDPALIRPAEVDLLIGDPSKARRILGWQPQMSFQQLIQQMVQADLDRLSSAPTKHNTVAPNPLAGLGKK